jgi:8-oxo-dGTP pyrophosphatase MutT (NUDIX family)
VTANLGVAPRDAATVMLVRDHPDLEVFMLRRNLDSVWIAGASVFPGGAVDVDDRHPRWEARCAGWDDRRATLALERADGGLGFFVAAVRETFEEAGVLLARDPSGIAADGRHDHLTAARVALNAGEHDFDTLVQRYDLVLATDELLPVSHWITPPGGPRRYDTWFFLAAAPEGEYLHDDTELIASAWVRPADALAAGDRGDVDLIFPTRKNLELLARFTSAADALTAVRAGATPDATGALRLVTDDGGQRIALPGDTAVDDGGVPCPA